MRYLAVLLLCGVCSAQSFWTREMKVETGLLTAEIAYDGVTTQKLMGRGYGEANPLARPMVTHGNAGQAAASAVGLGAVLGTSYLLHRAHHDKASRWVMRVAVVAEGVNDIRQSTLR